MRSILPALALSAAALIAVASCEDDGSPAQPGKDAGGCIGPCGRGIADVTPPSPDPVPRPPWAGDLWPPPVPVDAGPAPRCAMVGKPCVDLPCCAPTVCVDRIYTSLCEPVSESERCSPEGAPCSLGVACCPGTLCAAGAYGLTCAVEGGPEVPGMCGGLGAPCEMMPCCPGLLCVPRESGTYCMDRA